MPRAGLDPNGLAGSGDGDLRIGHPSGIITVAAEVARSGDTIGIAHASVYMTARRLFQGEVLYRTIAKTGT